MDYDIAHGHTIDTSSRKEFLFTFLDVRSTVSLYLHHPIVLVFQLYKYCSPMKERQWPEHLTCVLKRGVGTLSSVFTLKHKRVPMSCFDIFEHKQ